MAVAVQQPNREPKKDPLDLVIKGLQIAGSVYGIREASAKLDELDAQKQAREDSNAGVITPQQEAGLADKGFLRVPQGTPNAVAMKSSVDGSQIFMSPPKPKAELITPYQAEQLKIEREKLTAAQGDKKITPYQQAQLDLERKKLAMSSGKEKEAKPNQYQAATFGRRLEAAEDVFQNLSAEGYDRTSKSQGLLSALPGFAQPGKLKQQEQAERNFINAQLRRESGSAISTAEFESAEKQYFPRVGDTPEVLAQKEQNRAIARQGLMKEAGPAWNEVGQIALAPVKQKAGSGQAIAAPVSKPKTVMQNGHTYKLNEKTGKYE